MTAGDPAASSLRRDAERNRQRIIEAARDLCATRGLEATLNDVAHHAGLGVGTVYRRFPTKEDLFEAIFEENINELIALADTALDYDDSWEGFAWFVLQLCEITATNRGVREIVFSKAYGGHKVDRARTQLAPRLEALVERAKHDGYLRPELSATDMPILGLLSGAVSEFAGHIDCELWRRYTAILLDGMRCHNGQRTLEVDALSEDCLEAAMHTWHPAGPPCDSRAPALQEHDS